MFTMKKLAATDHAANAPGMKRVRTAIQQISEMAAKRQATLYPVITAQNMQEASEWASEYIRQRKLLLADDLEADADGLDMQNGPRARQTAATYRREAKALRNANTFAQ